MSYIQDEYAGGYPGDYLVPSQYVSVEAIENPVKVGSHQQWCFYTEDYKALLSENKEDQRTIVVSKLISTNRKMQHFNGSINLPEHGQTEHVSLIQI
ncbi:MAG: hypothetical protein ACLR6J_05635 [Parabacteroides merdae]